MKTPFSEAMAHALDQTRGGSLMDATRTVQRALSGSAESDDTAAAPEMKEINPRGNNDATGGEKRPAASHRPRRRLSAVLSGFAAGHAGPARGRQPELPEGATYVRRQFSGPGGSRAYTVYVPANLPDGAQGLVLMLHGCTQSADDFACGTGMNAVAERRGVIVVYAEQGRDANPQGCWNWFNPGDQKAGAGEPEILAGLATSVAQEFSVPADRIFAAGLSAGGAMAAILGVTHPEVFRAVGVHSGLAHGAAHDVPSAFAAMQGRSAGSGAAPAVPVIVFHGSADTTVAPKNAARIAGRGPGSVTQDRGQMNGRRVRVQTSGDGQSEVWAIDGLGHAWSGGQPKGSYTDAKGPDASAEMLRFFMDTARR